MTHPIVQIRSGPWALSDSVMTVLATTGPLLLLSSLDGRESGLAGLCGGFAALYGLGEPLRRRAAIVAAAGAGMTAVMVVCSLVHSSPWVAGIVLAITAALATYLIDTRAAGQPGMIMFLVTGSVALGVPAAANEIAYRALATAVGALIALTVSLALLVLRTAPRRRLLERVDARTARNHALRMAVATSLTGALVISAQVPHWQWAPISTAAVLQGTDTTTIFSRAVQRSAGTVAGVLITAALLMSHPAFFSTVLLCAACLGASQLLFPRNYALGIMCVTPLAFLLPGIAHPIGDSGLLLQRVWATALGAVLGVLMWYAARLRASRGQLPV